MSKLGDSRINLHRIGQIPVTCEKLLLALLTTQETFVNYFPSPEKFFVLHEWQDLVPRQHIDDCFENFGLSGSEYKNYASLMPRSQDVPNLSHEKCVRMQAFLYLRDFSVNSSNHSRRSRRRSFEFSESHAGFRDQFPGASSSLRSEAGLDGVLDESCDADVEDELDIPGTTIGTKFSVLHKMFFPCLVNRGCLLLAHSWVYPCSSKSSPNDRTAGVSSSVCTVTKRSRS